MGLMIALLRVYQSMLISILSSTLEDINTAIILLWLDVKDLNRSKHW